jgi:hypothetical protein
VPGRQAVPLGDAGFGLGAIVTYATEPATVEIPVPRFGARTRFGGSLGFGAL